MRIENEDLLEYMRRRPFCEWCGKAYYVCERLEPHHILCRGMGGGSSLDVALNLIAVHRTPCHQQAQEGGLEARDRCLEIVAFREGLESGEDVLACLWRLQRRKK